MRAWLLPLSALLAACSGETVPRYMCGENGPECGMATAVLCPVDEACVTDNGVRAGCHWCRPDHACDDPRSYCTDRRPELAEPMCGSTELPDVDTGEPHPVTIVFCN